MKIVILNSVFSESTSTGRLIREISEYLIENGEDVTVFYSQTKGINNVPVYAKKFGHRFENKIHAFLSRLTGKQGYYSYLGTKALIRNIKKEKPDIVHLHNLHSNDVFLPMLFKFLKKEDIGVVINLHDCWYYTGRCYHYKNVNCEQWKTGCLKCPSNCRSNPYWFFSRAKKLSKDKRLFFSLKKIRVVGVSEWIKSEAKKSFILQTKEIVSIYNWIDLNVFSPNKKGKFRDKYGLKNKKIILGVCSNWVNDKGLDDLLLLSKHLSDDIQLVLVGSVDDKIQEEYKDKILFLPPIYDKNLLAQTYADADVYVNLSKEESFGLTNAEALASGTPIIVYNSTAGPELVGDGCGYVARIDDIDDVLFGINELIKANRELLRVSCSNFARENFDKNKNIKKYLELYESLSQGD